MTEEFTTNPHRRLNILTGEWILVSPHRTKRPWKGKHESDTNLQQSSYDPGCYHCPGNQRAGGARNPDYQRPYSFQNDFSALLPQGDRSELKDGLLVGQGETGICRVVCFSPDHSLTLPLMDRDDISLVIEKWQEEFLDLGSREGINHVQIFENKGDIMGCSNPHPHGQIWSQFSIPVEVQKKTSRQQEYWKKHRKSLLGSYLEQELEKRERLILEEEHFVALVPFWAVWPYEAMILPKRHLQDISQMTAAERSSFAETIRLLTIRYDNLFETSFPYSSGIHQRPTDGKDHPHWHFHMSFYPPLLRSSTVKKFMVGYEMFAGPQRDITAEQAAETLRNLPEVHYLKRG